MSEKDAIDDFHVMGFHALPANAFPSTDFGGDVRKAISILSDRIDKLEIHYSEARATCNIYLENHTNTENAFTEGKIYNFAIAGPKYVEVINNSGNPSILNREYFLKYFKEVK